MSHIQVNREQVIPVRPEAVYSILSDYREKRPRLLTSNFLEYAIEKGGKGPGTVVTYRLRSGGRERPYRMRIEEPVKGRILSESDTDSSLITTWTISPMQGGEQTHVRVETEWEGGRGVRGFFERTFAPLGLRRIYNFMLTQLFQEAGGDVYELEAQRQDSIATNIQVFSIVFGAVVAGTLAITFLSRRRG